ncbi:MAG: hypothetical protein AAF310_00085 [Myxococcota bacterium]
MVNWERLLQEIKGKKDFRLPADDWRKEVIDSMYELYYSQYRIGRGCQRIDTRPGSDYDQFVKNHMVPLSKYRVWEALFPTRESAQKAIAIDEALRLMADTKIVDRIYSEDIVTVRKIVTHIRKKREKYASHRPSEEAA